MIIKDLPEDIRNLVYKRVVEQKKEFSLNKNLFDSSTLYWASTPEGMKFWIEINVGNYIPFYNKYPKTIDSYSII